MVKQIEQITNVGKFESFSNETQFDKNNIIFGFNGAGKSTLSDIFYSLAHTGKEEIITRRVTLKRDETEPEKRIYINLMNENDDKIEFNGSQWQNAPQNIFVFNNQYVQEHVFVSKELKGNTVPIGMGPNGVKYMSQREKISQDIAQLIVEMNNTINILTAADFKIKDITASKITAKTSLRRYNSIAHFELFPLSSEKMVKEKIKSNIKYSQEKEKLERCHQLYSTISGIQSFNSNKVMRSIQKVPRISSKELAEYLAETLTVSDIKWAVRGYKNQREKSVCPMCGQLISDQKAIDFFYRLGKYINQNRDENIKAYSASLNNFAGYLHNIEINQKIEIFNEIINILGTINLLRQKDISRLEKVLSWKKIHTDCLERIIEKIYIKAENPYIDIYFNDEENDCLLLLKKVIRNISVLGEIIVQCEERLNQKISKTMSFDDMTILSNLSFGTFRSHMENLKNQASQMIKLLEKLNILSVQIDDCYNQIQLNTVNEFLSRLNTNIKIEVANKKYFIRLRDYSPQEYSKEVGNTIFSEGEQKAIAFAYFLSELKNYNFALGKRLIVIDDPISSMDLCRKSIISYQIAELMKDINSQVFVLSHDITFIERIINYINSNVIFNSYELVKNKFIPLNINDYLTNDEQVYEEFIKEAEIQDNELTRILALMSLRPYAYVKKVSETDFNNILVCSTYFSHTLYSWNRELHFKIEDYSTIKLKEYIKLVNSLTNSNFDEEKIIGTYTFDGFDFSSLVNLYMQIPLNTLMDARKKVLLMRPLIEACFFQLSSKVKFDPQNIGKMYKTTINGCKNNPKKYNICKSLLELYDSSKKYHHGAENGSLLGITWINPSEIEFYNTTLEKIISDIQSMGVIRQIGA